MKLSSSNIKKSSSILSKESFSYVFSKESFSCISRNGTLHFLVQVRKIKKIRPEKISYASGNGNPQKNFLYFLKRNLFFYFGKQKP